MQVVGACTTGGCHTLPRKCVRAESVTLMGPQLPVWGHLGLGAAAHREEVQPEPLNGCWLQLCVGLADGFSW